MSDSKLAITNALPLLEFFPPETIINILEQWIGIPDIIWTIDPDFEDSIMYYDSPVDLTLLPPSLQQEHNRLLRQTFLRSEKTFTNVLDFIAVHLACIPHSRAKFAINDSLNVLAQQKMQLPWGMRPHPNVLLHGLEKIRMDLTAPSYFSMFKVHIPPFNLGQHQHASPFADQEYGAATFLAHTKELVLVFGSTYAESHAWYELDAWEGEVVDDDGASQTVGRYRPDVCTKGKVVDWILTYAWHHELLQHIPCIALEGDVQEWVREKWTKVFSRTHPEQDFVGSDDDMWQIETAPRLRWITEFPPACTCKIDCWRLRDGEVLPEVKCDGWGTALREEGTEEQCNLAGKVPAWYGDWREPEGNW